MPRGRSLLDRGIVPIAERMIGAAAIRCCHAKAFGPYRITGVLGEGGMGVVYRAERDDLGSVAAIKILRDAWLSPARRERFASEQRTLAQLNHPSIARLYDAGTLRRRHAVVRDGVRRRHAAHRVLPCARTPPSSERLRLFRDVCEAVQHAHQQPGHPPRSEAVEHSRQRRRQREAARLRHRQAARSDSDGRAAPIRTDAPVPDCVR